MADLENDGDSVCNMLIKIRLVWQFVELCLNWTEFDSRN